MAKPKRDPTPAERLLAACQFCALIENSKTNLEFHNGLVMSKSASGVVLAMPTEQGLPVAVAFKQFGEALKACKDGVAVMTSDGNYLSVTSGALVTRVQTFPAMLAPGDALALNSGNGVLWSADVRAAFAARLTTAVEDAYRIASSTVEDAPAGVEPYASRLFFDSGFVRGTNGAAYLESWVGALPISDDRPTFYLNGAMPLDVAKAIVKSKALIVGIVIKGNRVGFLLDNGGEVCAEVSFDVRLLDAPTIAEKSGLSRAAFDDWSEWPAPNAEVLAAAKRLKKGVVRLRGRKMERENQEIELSETHTSLTYCADVLALLDGMAEHVLHTVSPEATLFVGGACRGLVMGVKEGEAV